MKVPHRVVGRTQSSSRSLAPVRVDGISAEAFGAGIGRGLQSFGKAINSFEAKAQASSEQGDRYIAAQAYSDFQTKVNTDLTNLERDTDPSGKDYAVEAGKIYDKQQKTLGKNVPKSQHDAIFAKENVFRGNTKLNVLKGANAKRDLTQIGKINDMINAAKVRIFNNPATSDDEQSALSEFITATDLPLAEKQKYQRIGDIAINTIAYKDKVIKEKAAVRSFQSKSTVGKIGYIESRNNPNAKNPNSSASGEGQFIKSTWMATVKKHAPELFKNRSRAQVLALRNHPQIGRQMLAAHTQDNNNYLTKHGVQPTEGNLYLAHFLGASKATQLLRANPNSPVNTVVSSGAIKANGNIMRGKTIGQVIQWASNKMVGATPNKLDTNAKYKNLSFEKRLAIRQDAETELNTQSANQIKQQKADQAAITNQLAFGIRNGTNGQADIDTVAKSGKLAFKDIAYLDAQLKKYQGDAQDLAKAQQNRNDPTHVFSGKQGRKDLNLLVGDAGLNRIGKGDAEYVTNELLPLVSDTKAIPTEALAALTVLARNSDIKKSIFAMNVLSQMERASPEAFAAQVTKKVAQDVRYYNNNVDTQSQEELFKRLRNGDTFEERQANEFLQKEARGILTSEASKLSIDNIVDSFDDTFALNPFSSGPALVKVPKNTVRLKQDYDEHFIEAWMKYRDVDKAHADAVAGLKKTWGATNVGGENILMKYPPEKIGLPKFKDSHEWINKQGRKRLQLEDGEDYRILSDSRTRKEFEAWRADPSAPSPSYQVITVKDAVIGTNAITRMNFAPTEKMVKAESAFLGKQIYDAQLNNLTKELGNIMTQEGTFNPNNVEAMQDSIDNFESKYGKIDMNKLTEAQRNIFEEFTQVPDRAPTHKVRDQFVPDLGGNKFGGQKFGGGKFGASEETK